MKSIKLLLTAALAAVFISGCASNDVKKAEADAAIAQGNARVAEAQASAEEARAVQRLADKVDAGGATAYLLAKAFKGMGLGAQPAAAPAPPQNLWGVAFNTLLAVADRGLQFWQIKSGRDVAMAQSANARDVAISTNQAFLGMGSYVRDAGIAGYPFVQAPAANVTNTYTLSGTGVLGSGTYTGPITTTTNCNGGTAAPGGNGGTTGAGGTGGGAPGGSC
jgi:hypothetical protein